MSSLEVDRRRRLRPDDERRALRHRLPSHRHVAAEDQIAQGWIPLFVLQDVSLDDPDPQHVAGRDQRAVREPRAAPHGNATDEYGDGQLAPSDCGPGARRSRAIADAVNASKNDSHRRRSRSPTAQSAASSPGCIREAPTETHPRRTDGPTPWRPRPGPRTGLRRKRQARSEACATTTANAAGKSER